MRWAGPQPQHADRSFGNRTEASSQRHRSRQSPRSTTWRIRAARIPTPDGCRARARAVELAVRGARGWHQSEVPSVVPETATTRAGVVWRQWCSMRAERRHRAAPLGRQVDGARGAGLLSCAGATPAGGSGQLCAEVEHAVEFTRARAAGLLFQARRSGNAGGGIASALGSGNGGRQRPAEVVRARGAHARRRARACSMCLRP
jgi:hypothetical protein